MSLGVIEDTIKSPVEEMIPEKKKSIPCFFYEDCQSDAEHLVLRTCCGNEMYLCEDCLLYVMETTRKEESPFRECLICDRIITDLPNWLKYIGRL